jgi:hypothetical protein
MYFRLKRDIPREEIIALILKHRYPKVFIEHR